MLQRQPVGRRMRGGVDGLVMRRWLCRVRRGRARLLHDAWWTGVLEMLRWRTLLSVMRVMLFGVASERQRHELPKKLKITNNNH